MQAELWSSSKCFILQINATFGWMCLQRSEICVKWQPIGNFKFVCKHPMYLPSAPIGGKYAVFCRVGRWNISDWNPFQCIINNIGWCRRWIVTETYLTDLSDLNISLSSPLSYCCFPRHSVRLLCGSVFIKDNVRWYPSHVIKLIQAFSEKNLAAIIVMQQLRVIFRAGQIQHFLCTLSRQTFTHQSPLRASEWERLNWMALIACWCWRSVVLQSCFCFTTQPTSAHIIIIH